VLANVAREAGATPHLVARSARYEGELTLFGAHQYRNAAVAQATLAKLPPAFRPTRHETGRAFRATQVPGRFDRRGKWILDVAHNPDGVAVLVGLLRAADPPRPLHALLAVLGDKDWRAMMDGLLPVVDEIWCTNAPSAPEDRRWDAGEAVLHAGGTARAEPDFDAALAGVERQAATVLVCGSFHTVGDAMSRLPGFTPIG
jgi:dihydrofolate synthase/folylpolyglutamate synthase